MAFIRNIPGKMESGSDKKELSEIIGVLKTHYPRFQQKYHITEISIIGSYARGEQTEDSDLDIMVDFTEPIGWEVVDLREELENLSGLNVDLILKAGVKQRKKIYAGIVEDAVYV